MDLKEIIRRTRELGEIQKKRKLTKEEIKELRNFDLDVLTRAQAACIAGDEEWIIELAAYLGEIDAVLYWELVCRESSSSQR